MAIVDQREIREHLVKVGKHSKFGADHGLIYATNYKRFKQRIPLRNYEDFKPFIDRIRLAERDVLWPGLPKYLAKTSGTTSGAKYIPISDESIKSHINTARNATLNYMIKSGNHSLFDGKAIFLTGSPVLEEISGIKTGRLSGIVNHEIPFYVKSSQLPSQATNSISDWDKKLDAIVEETLDTDMRLISGIPPWIKMYYEKLIQASGKSSVSEIFPNYQTFFFGGCNYAPYKKVLEELVGRPIDVLETYPASEGFIAFQNEVNDPGLLLNTNSGIFFEFVKVENIRDENPERIDLSEVELGVNYAIIISNTAGLWGYILGDTIEFVSTHPFKIMVTGRINHHLSAFGEHVIAKEVEYAIQEAMEQTHSTVVDFTVAPQVNPESGSLPYHEWYIEFKKAPDNMVKFSTVLNNEMIKQNIYYEDLINDGVLRPLVIKPVQDNGFEKYMDSIGKLGGQNKVPHLADHRKIAEGLKPYLK